MSNVHNETAEQLATAVSRAVAKAVNLRDAINKTYQKVSLTAEEVAASLENIATQLRNGNAAMDGFYWSQDDEKRITNYWIVLSKP